MYLSTFFRRTERFSYVCIIAFVVVRKKQTLLGIALTARCSAFAVYFPRGTEYSVRVDVSVVCALRICWRRFEGVRKSADGAAFFAR